MKNSVTFVKNHLAINCWFRVRKKNITSNAKIEQKNENDTDPF